MTKKRAILHIGSPKTGTTTLQKTLASLRRDIAAEGVLYPFFKGSVNHGRLSLLGRNDPPMREFRQEEQLNIQDYRREGRRALSSVCHQMGKGDFHTLVLSSEYLFYQAQNFELDMLHDRLSEIVDEIVVVAYLRDPVAYYTSMALQMFKASEVAQGPYAPRYLEILDAYASRFNITVRHFQRDTLHQGDLVADFFHHFLPGLDIPSPALFNDSLSPEGTKLLNLHRAQYFPGKNDIFYPEGRRLIRMLREAETAAPPTAEAAAKTVLRPEIAAFIEDRFDAQRDGLRDRFGIDFIRSVAPGTSAANPERGGDNTYSVDGLFELSAPKLAALTASVLHKSVNGKG